MISLARSEPGIPVTPRELDSDPWLFNVVNGTIDLRTGQLREHRREDMITMLAPVVFDPKARNTIWESFLDRVLPDPALQGFVQRAAGYSVTGDCSEEVLFFPYGSTQTGKSTLLRALAKTFGDYAMTADFGAFLARDRNAGGPRNDIAAMSGKRMVVSVEVDPGQRMGEALVKQLTGGDDVRARFLFQESFEFAPTFKIWLAANDRPHVRDDDDAIWRRILQIPFDARISEEERNPAIKAHLCDPESAGAAILAWCNRGAWTGSLSALWSPTPSEPLRQSTAKRWIPWLTLFPTAASLSRMSRPAILFCGMPMSNGHRTVASGGPWDGRVSLSGSRTGGSKCSTRAVVIGEELVY